MTVETRVFCERSWRRNVIDVFITEVNTSSGTTYATRPVVMERLEDGAASEPAMHLNPTAAQMFMDELWRCGIRPTEGTGSAGSLAATERHLKDMRTFAFKLLNEEKELADMAREHGMPKHPMFTPMA